MKTCNKLSQEKNPQSIPETKTYLENIIKLKEKTLGLLRDFLMTNNLPIEPHLTNGTNYAINPLSA